MDVVNFYKIDKYDINFLEMIIQSYENFALFSTMDSKIAVVRIIIDNKNNDILTQLLISLDINIEKLDSYTDEIK
jgi:hypothetical protein